MNESQRVDRPESICRAQQRILDSLLQHLNTMAGQTQTRARDQPTITRMLDGSEQSAVEAARRL